MSVNKEDLGWTISPSIAFNWSKADIESVIAHLAMDNIVHPFKDIYLEGLKGKWDKTDRLWTPNLIEKVFFVNYDGTKEENEMRREILRLCVKLIFGGIIERTMNPGCNLEEAVVLASPKKNIGKSSFFKNLMPSPEFFMEGYDLRTGTKQAVEDFMGKILILCDELDGLEEKYLPRVKVSFSTSTRRARIAYGKVSKDYPAMHIFVGTCNDMTPLPYEQDGYRRFVFGDPDGIGPVPPEILLPEIRDQLFAQGIHEYLEGNLTGKTTYEEIETIKAWSKRFMRQPEIKECILEAITMIKEAGYTRFSDTSLQSFIEYQWQFEFDEPTKRGGDPVKVMKNAIFRTNLVHRKEGKADQYWQIKGTRGNDQQKVFEGRLDGRKSPDNEESRVIDMDKYLVQQGPSQRKRLDELKAKRS